MVDVKMALYARVVTGGLVVETFEPPGSLSITDCFHPDVAAQFVPVPDGVPVVEGWTYDGAGIFSPPVVPPLTVQEQAQMALAAGCQIVSSATPAVSGTYPLDPATNIRTNSIATYILLNNTFPGGATTYSRADINGTPHAFPSVSVYQEWASAIADYVSALDIIILTGEGTLPAQPVNIP